MSSMGGFIGYTGFSLYHTTKWGIEGFYECFADEVESFGIRTTLIEPGMIRTSFYDAVQKSPVLGAYAGNPAIWRGDANLQDMPGDQAKVVKAMLDVAGADDPPRRLLLGSDAYQLVTTALAGRLAAFKDQKDLALLHRRRRPPASRQLTRGTMSNHRFTGKTIIITGAAGALGSGMSRRFAAEGANVALGARRQEQVAALAEELGHDKALFTPLDVTSQQAWANAVSAAEEKFGPVSVLVSNAARATMGTIESLSPGEFHAVALAPDPDMTQGNR
jgi:NAD(P)-dependent dehydrogenase (short-subunit alcohol dehydrogenase family)